MANTIAGANLAVIAEATLPHLEAVFSPLAGVVTDFSSDIAVKGESVTTRVATVPTAADLSSGYTSGNTTLTAYTTTLDKFYGYVVGFKDSERSKSSIDLNRTFVSPMVEALATQVFGDLWNLVVNANFSSSEVIAAASFDRDDLIDIRATLNTAKAPKMDRTVWANSSYYANLLKTLNSAEIPGMTVEKAEGVVPRVAGFDVYEQSLADANGESLGVFCFQKSALIMAARGVDTPSEFNGSVENLVIPGLNIPVQMRQWYDADGGELKTSISLLYGVKAGPSAYGHRVTTA